MPPSYPPPSAIACACIQFHNFQFSSLLYSCKNCCNFCLFCERAHHAPPPAQNRDYDTFVSENAQELSDNFNALDSKANHSATSNNTKLVHWPLMGGLLHLVQRGGDWAELQPAQAPTRTKCYSPPINGQCTNHRIAV